jgi:hypothetical protein
MLLCLFVVVGIGACSFVRGPSPDELHAVEHPSPEQAAWLDSVAPRATEWYIAQESVLRPRGRPLTADEIEIAKKTGVQHPEEVRVFVLDEFPFPDDPVLAKELKALGLGSRHAGGFTMGYVVLLKPQYDTKRWLLAHELVHVAQRERLGTETFVRRYLMELRVMGYARAPLELEANKLMQSAK